MKVFLIYILLLGLIACDSSNESSLEKSQKTEDYSSYKNSNGNNKNEPSKDESKIIPNIIDHSNNNSNNGISSISELWNTYKTAKASATEASNNGDLISLIENCEISASAAIELNRGDLAADQLNRIGVYSIDEFSQKTNYNDRIQTLAIIEDPIKRNEYHIATKDVFMQNYKILLDAEPYLQQAYKLDKNYSHSGRSESINRNLNFIRWVRKFLNTKYSQQTE